MRPEHDPLAAAAAPAEVITDPMEAVEVAVEQDAVDPSDPYQPSDEERALVTDWWDRTAQTAEFTTAVKQADQDLETLNGGTPAEINDPAEITVQHVYRNAIQTVALTVPEMQSVRWKPRKEVEPLPGMPRPPQVRQRKQQQQGLASVITCLFWRYAELGHLQEKVEAWVQDSVHFPMAILKVHFQTDLEADAITEDRLPDEQDLIARLRVLIQRYDAGEFTDHEAEYAELRSMFQAVGRTEVPVRRGVVVEQVPIDQYRCDPSVSGPEMLHTATWERHDLPMQRDEVMAKFGLRAEDLQKARVHRVDQTGRLVIDKREARTESEATVYDAVERSGAMKSDDWLLVAEIYDYQSNHRLILVEGLDWPVVHKPLEQGPTGMSPFVVLVENRKPGSLYGYSDTQLQAKTQRQMNKTRTQEDDSRRRAQPRWGYDPANLQDPKVLTRVEQAPPGSFIPIPVLKTDKLSDAFFPLHGNHDHNPEEYRTDQLTQEMRKMAMLPESASGELGKAEFAAEVQAAAAGANALARYRQTRILRALRRLYSKIAQLILHHMPWEEAVRLAGPMAGEYYPREPMDRHAIYDGLEIQVEVAMDRQLDYAKRAEALARLLEAARALGVTIDSEGFMKLLAKLLSLDEAADLIDPDPNALVGRLMEAVQEGNLDLAPEALAALAQMGQMAGMALQQQQVQAAQQQAAGQGGAPPMGA